MRPTDRQLVNRLRLAAGTLEALSLVSDAGPSERKGSAAMALDVAEAADALERADSLREALRKVEWVELEPRWFFCNVTLGGCGAIREEGHTSDCALAALLDQDVTA